MMTDDRACPVVARGALWLSAKCDRRAKSEASLIRELGQCKRGSSIIHEPSLTREAGLPRELGERVNAE